MGKANCADDILAQLTSEKSPSTATRSTETSIRENTSFVVVVVEEEDRREHETQLMGNCNKVKFIRRSI